MKIALVQFDIAWEDPAENHRRVAGRLEEAAREGARLALLPEMFPTGFSMDAARIAQPPGGQTEAFLKKIAGELSLWIIGSIPEAGGGETPEGQASAPRNTALVVSPAGEVVRYSKFPVHVWRRTRRYAAGDRSVRFRSTACS